MEPIQQASYQITYNVLMTGILLRELNFGIVLFNNSHLYIPVWFKIQNFGLCTAYIQWFFHTSLFLSSPLIFFQQKHASHVHIYTLLLIPKNEKLRYLPSMSMSMVNSVRLCTLINCMSRSAMFLLALSWCHADMTKFFQPSPLWLPSLLITPVWITRRGHHLGIHYWKVS